MRLLISILILIPFLSFGQHQLFHKGEIAFDGNDIISYHSGKPVKGKPEFSYTYKDIPMQFASKANLDKFKSDPEKYMPAYDGWCALAIAEESYVRPNFNTYKIQDGELLFFEVRAFFNGKTFWEKDPDINKIVADKKYRDLQGKKN